jgi:hypothetical protein
MFDDSGCVSSPKPTKDTVVILATKDVFYVALTDTS